MQTTFGEWVRWKLARLGIDRAAAAKRLGCDTKTVTNLYRRADPEGVNDVFLSRLAAIFDLTEPELMTKWKEGLPPVDGKSSKKGKASTRGAHD